MAYTPFVENKPVLSDGGAAVVSSIRENLEALRDAVVAGRVAGWQLAVTGADALQPTGLTWSKGVERIRLLPNWGTSGVTDGSPTSVRHQYSSDSGSNYDDIGLLVINYDGDGAVSGTSWS